LPPRSKNALYLDFAFEVLQSGNLAVVAAFVPVRSDVLRVRTSSN
jgi:hypothetical protein